MSSLDTMQLYFCSVGKVVVIHTKNIEKLYKAVMKFDYWNTRSVY